MTPEQLIAGLETIAEAPGGVAHIERMVLGFAMTGRLLVHRGDDNVEEVRRRLSQAGKARKSGAPGAVQPLERAAWPYEVPKHWVWITLKDVGVIVSGGTPRADDPENFTSDGGIPWLTPADMRRHVVGKLVFRGDRNLTEKGLESCSAQVMPVGSVVFSSRAPIGYVAIAGAPLSTNQGFKSISPFIPEMADFLYWYLRFAAPRINELAPGTTFKEVSGGFMAEYPVPVPPLSEQRSIVEAVDHLLAGLTEYAEAQSLRNELHRQYAEAAAFHALNG